MRWLVLGAVVLALASCSKKGEAAAGPSGEGVFPSGGNVVADGMGGGRATPAAPRNLPPGVVVLQRVAVEDPGVIARGPALRGLVPAGWRVEGGITPGGAACSEPYLVNWRAVSPDGASTVSLFPTEGWQWSNTQIQSDCKTGDFTNIRDYLSARAAAVAPGARVLDFRNRQDFAKGAIEVAEMTQRNISAALGGTNEVRVRAEGGEILYAFTENGVEKRGLMSAVGTFYIIEMANPMAASPEFDPLRGQPIRSVTGSTVGTFAATAPAGQLDFEMAEAIRRSFTPDPRWLTALFDLKGKLGDIQTQGVRERAAIIVAGGAAATRSNIAAFEAMTNASIANSNASINATRPQDGGVFPGDKTGDRMQRESIEAVRGVETYHDPVDGMNVQLDATYDHAWRINNNDAYILTKDPNFNPGQYGIEATQMGVVK